MILIHSLILVSCFCLYSQTNSVTDIDGNTYKTVRIGDQIWMAENLRTSKFNDGSQIAQVTDNTSWSQTRSSAWCWFGNDSNHDKVYGKLYNWYAVANDNLCPTGWHLPTEAHGSEGSDWATLIRTLGGSDQAGGKLKQQGFNFWLAPNIGANNQAGFLGLPGGSRQANGVFDGIRFEGMWWNSLNSSLLEFTWSRSRILLFDSDRVDYFDGDKRMGLSVRCIKG